MYTIASGANHGLRYVKEATPGVTPASPVMIELAHTGCSLGLTRDTFTSNALRSDRQIPLTGRALIRSAATLTSSSGAVEYDPLLEAALGGTGQKTC